MSETSHTPADGDSHVVGEKQQPDPRFNSGSPLTGQELLLAIGINPSLVFPDARAGDAASIIEDHEARCREEFEAKYPNFKRDLFAKIEDFEREKSKANGQVGIQ